MSTQPNPAPSGPTPNTLRSWLDTALVQYPEPLPELARYNAIIERTCDAWASPYPWRDIPHWIQAAFTERGWLWNGIYTWYGDALHLFAAAGPPVCATLAQHGGIGTSGMCVDAVLMNQTLLANDVKAWPGYVSCDGESGLQTKSGLVVPIRDASRQPIAVWDLDSTESLHASDAYFFERYFATLCALTPPQHEELK